MKNLIKNTNLKKEQLESIRLYGSINTFGIDDYLFGRIKYLRESKFEAILKAIFNN